MKTKIDDPAEVRGSHSTGSCGKPQPNSTEGGKAIPVKVKNRYRTLLFATAVNLFESEADSSGGWTYPSIRCRRCYRQQSKSTHTGSAWIGEIGDSGTRYANREFDSAASEIWI